MRSNKTSSWWFKAQAPGFEIGIFVDLWIDGDVAKVELIPNRGDIPATITKLSAPVTIVRDRYTKAIKEVIVGDVLAQDSGVHRTRIGAAEAWAGKQASALAASIRKAEAQA